MSECMQEVSRLLSIKGLTSMPYHPICNGLVKRWNGTLKSMLKRLCQDQLKQWHKLINPVLFAYREVTQESTGFSPFQLLYGHSVRGPGTILKELWTKEVNIPKVKSSYEYVTELRERLEDSLKLAQEELEKSQKDFWKVLLLLTMCKCDMVLVDSFVLIYKGTLLNSFRLELDLERFVQ